MTESTLPESSNPELATTLAPAPPVRGVGLEHARVKSLVRNALFGGDSIPLRIGKFTVLRRLGAGGMGVVYSAFDDDLERKVAIKLIRPDGVDPVTAGVRLRREALTIARLSHPNVVPIFEVGDHRGEIYLAMEFVHGSTLRSWLGHEPRSWQAIRDVFVQAGKGLEAAHRAGIVHRDFKPDNVMVGDDGRVRVLDFGVAAVNDSEAEALAGTPAYMAPEALRGAAVDARSDQFSFCVALFEALFGRRPFVGTDLGRLLRAMSDRSPLVVPTTPALPHRFRAALLRGLSFDPADRFEQLEALLAELEYDPRVARRRWTVGISIGLASMGGAVGIAAPLLADGDRCDAVEIDSVWSPDRKEAAQAALAASPRPPSLQAWASATAAIDRYVEGWHLAFERICSDDAGDDEVRLRQQLCMQWAATDLAEAIAPLFDGDSPITAEIPARVEALVDPQVCLDARAVAEFTRERSLRTAPPPRGSEVGVVSDFEREPLAAIGAGWVVSNDGLIGGTSRVSFEVVEGGVHGSGHALRIHGQVGDSEPAWAGAMLFTGERVFAPANLQGMRRFSFWATGERGDYVVMLFTERRSFDPVMVPFSLGEGWQRIDVELDTVLPERFDVTGLFIGAVEPGPFELRVDDVELESS